MVKGFKFKRTSFSRLASVSNTVSHSLRRSQPLPLSHTLSVCLSLSLSSFSSSNTNSPSLLSNKHYKYPWPVVCGHLSKWSQALAVMSEQVVSSGVFPCIIRTPSLGANQVRPQSNHPIRSGPSQSPNQDRAQSITQSGQGPVNHPIRSGPCAA